MSKIVVNPMIPSSFVPKPLMSSSKHVIRKRLVEILPENAVTYSPGGNSRITFNVSSATDFLIGLESFLRFELRVTGTANGSADTFVHLNTGGAHALFSRMEIRLPNGTQIELIDDYARWYAINSCATHSRQHVDYMEQASGDSSSWRPYQDNRDVDLAYQKTAGPLAYAGLNTLAVANDDAVITPVGFGIRPLIPASASLKNQTQMDDEKDLDASYNGAGAIWPARTRVCKNGSNDLTVSGYTVTMKLFSQFLSQQEVIPLALLQGGFQVVCDLQNAVQALSLHENIEYNGAEALDYNIVRPRFFASMVQPSEMVMKDYIALYNAEKLNYAFTGVRHYLNVQNGSDGSMSFPLNVNVRSVRSVVTVVQNFRANTATQNATHLNVGGTLLYTNDRSSYGYDATGRFLKAGIKSYQYQVGSDNFPERAVQLRISDATDDLIMAEAFSHLTKTFGHHSSTLFEPRFPQSEWSAQNFDDEQNQNESWKLIMSARLDRGDDTLVGYDCSINPLNIVLEAGSIYTTDKGQNSRYIHSYVTFDNILSISNSGVVNRR